MALQSLSLPRHDRTRSYERARVLPVQHERPVVERVSLLKRMTDSGGLLRSRARYTLARVRHFAYPRAKRAQDIVLALLGILLLTPLFALVALLIRLQDGGPALYVQDRVGRGGKTFRMLKFRSMHLDADGRRAALQAASGQTESARFKLIADPRITPVGRFIRKASIDELPQLWNVLLGDMTLVGPRPPLPSEARTYAAHAWARMDVTPGLTCTWQISGRSDIPFEQQVELDLAYIRERGFAHDVRILISTLPAVVTGRGAY